MPTANTPAQAPAHESGSRPEDDNHKKNMIAPNLANQLIMRTGHPTEVPARWENKPEDTTSARPMKKRFRLSRHIRTAPTVSKAKPLTSFRVELFQRSCITTYVHISFDS